MNRYEDEVTKEDKDDKRSSKWYGILIFILYVVIRIGIKYGDNFAELKARTDRIEEASKKGVSLENWPDMVVSRGYTEKLTIRKKLAGEYFTMLGSDEREEENILFEIEMGFPLRDGVYLCKVDEYISWPEVFWEESETDMVDQNFNSYEISFWEEKEGGMYILYVDPVALDLSINCKISIDGELPLLYTSTTVVDPKVDYCYRIGDYRAIALDILAGEENACHISIY
ncbi:MAG: hypothetical protein IJP31_00970 [Lachnospiraceae bacterium]|nr:hypothetical protein [Lachnospiraceae bacterium]